MFRKGRIIDPDVIQIFNVPTEVEAGQAKELLENAGIPCIVMDREDSGHYLRVLGYGSPFGFDIYVGKDCVAEARQLLEEIFSEENAVTGEELEEIALQAHSDDV